MQWPDFVSDSAQSSWVLFLLLWNISMLCGVVAAIFPVSALRERNVLVMFFFSLLPGSSGFHHCREYFYICGVSQIVFHHYSPAECASLQWTLVLVLHLCFYVFVLLCFFWEMLFIFMYTTTNDTIYTRISCRDTLPIYWMLFTNDLNMRSKVHSLVGLCVRC